MTKPLHFLVTDDDADKRAILCHGLRKEFPHASIFECHSGQEALDYFAANHVDAIITDHSMQPVNGIELVVEIRRRGGRLPIVMVSGHPEVRPQAEAAGVDVFFATEWTQAAKELAAYLRGRGLCDCVES
jgi:CheY-like chemotaxis protein